MSIFDKKRPKTAYVCYRCDQTFRGEPFTSWSGGGITIKENSRDLCLSCVADIAIEEANSMKKQPR